MCCRLFFLWNWSLLSSEWVYNMKVGVKKPKVQSKLRREGGRDRAVLQCKLHTVGHTERVEFRKGATYSGCDKFKRVPPTLGVTNFKRVPPTLGATNSKGCHLHWVWQISKGCHLHWVRQISKGCHLHWWRQISKGCHLHWVRQISKGCHLHWVRQISKGYHLHCGSDREGQISKGNRLHCGSDWEGQIQKGTTYTGWDRGQIEKGTTSNLPQTSGTESDKKSKCSANSFQTWKYIWFYFQTLWTMGQGQWTCHNQVNHGRDYHPSKPAELLTWKASSKIPMFNFWQRQQTCEIFPFIYTQGNYFKGYLNDYVHI